jgi:hypothetical protein
VPTYTVLTDAYNFVRKNELADRVEHVTVRRGETVDLDAKTAAAGVEAGWLAEGEVDPDTYLAEQAAATQAAAAAEAGDEETTAEETTTRRRR